LRIDVLSGVVERRLELVPHVAAAVVFVCGLLIAPSTTADDRQRLSPFFSTTASILATLLVAAALFQGLPSSPISYEVRRFLGVMSFVYLGSGLVASVSALTDVLPIGLYAWAFAVTLGAGAGALLALLFAGARNIREQRAIGLGQRAEQLTSPDTPPAPLDPE
jgi:hypothetical protein